jgi:hypothetical protein
MNSGGGPVMPKASGFPLEFIPIEIGAGMTFLEAALSIMDRKLDNFYTIYSL